MGPGRRGRRRGAILAVMFVLHAFHLVPALLLPLAAAGCCLTVGAPADARSWR